MTNELSKQLNPNFEYITFENLQVIIFQKTARICIRLFNGWSGIGSRETNEISTRMDLIFELSTLENLRAHVLHFPTTCFSKDSDNAKCCNLIGQSYR